MTKAMVTKADQARVKDLITETITLLCKNGLHFQSEFTIQALIGVTLDKNEVFLVNIDETIVIPDNGQTTLGKETLNAGANGDPRGHGSVKRKENTKVRRGSNMVCALTPLNEADPVWLDQNRSEMDLKETVADAEKGRTPDAPALLSLSSEERKRHQNGLVDMTSSLSATSNGTRQDGSCSNLDLITNSHDDDFVSEGQAMEHHNTVALETLQGYGRDGGICREVKQEPNSDDDVSDTSGFQPYSDQILASYSGVSGLFQNPVFHAKLIDKQPLDDMSIQGYHYPHHQQQVVQHDMVNSNKTSHLQTRLGHDRSALSLNRRRSLMGPAYRMPRNHICAICGKAFEKKRDLRGHQAAKHQMEKEHKCDICGKEFSYKRSLTDHMFVHTRDRLISGSAVHDLS